jgi:Tfp pilus assembly protein PilF
MKLGAVDFIQKPIALEQVRALVRQIMDREALDEESAAGYDGLIELAKKYIGRRELTAARRPVERAMASDPRRPEAYNLLGVLEEIAGRRLEAQAQYRMALAAEPSYRPAQQNLSRSTQPPESRRGPMRW